MSPEMSFLARQNNRIDPEIQRIIKINPNEAANAPESAVKAKDR